MFRLSFSKPYYKFYINYHLLCAKLAQRWVRDERTRFILIARKLMPFMHLHYEQYYGKQYYGKIHATATASIIKQDSGLESRNHNVAMEKQQVIQLPYPVPWIPLLPSMGIGDSMKNAFLALLMSIYFLLALNISGDGIQQQGSF